MAHGLSAPILYGTEKEREIDEVFEADMSVYGRLEHNTHLENEIISQRHGDVEQRQLRQVYAYVIAHKSMTQSPLITYQMEKHSKIQEKDIVVS